MKSKLTYWLTFMLLAVASAYGQVTTVTSPAFNKYFKVTGDATLTTPSNRVTLTPFAGFKTGYATSRIEVDLSQNFSIDLDWYLGSTSAGADGTNFYLYSSNTNKEFNTSGTGIYYRFDTYWNLGDITCTGTDNYWRFINNGVSGPPNVSTCFATNMEDNALHNCVISWDATTKKFSMSWDGTTRHTSTAVSNISASLGGTRAFFSFYGATGGAMNLQQVTINSMSGNFPPVISLDADKSSLPAKSWDYRSFAGLNVATKIADADVWANSFANFASGDRVTATITVPSALSSETLSTTTLPAGVSASVATVSGNRVLTLSNIASNADILTAINAVRYTIGTTSDMATLGYTRTLNVQIEDLYGKSDLVNVTLLMNTPGGVASGYLGWYRGDNASNTATVWSEQNQTGNAVVDLGAPVLNASGPDLLNFNKTYSFSGDIMTLPAALDVGGNGQPYSFFGVAKLKGTANARVFSSETTNNVFGYLGGNENSLYINATPNYQVAGSNGVVAATTNLNQFTLNRTAAEVVVQRRNGTQVNTSSTSNDALWRISLGGWGQSNNQTSDVVIGEFISYETDNTANLNPIESYLATKYGISRRDGIGINYIASDNSTTYWDIAINSGFNNDIFGLGRDNTTLLHQRISTSANADDFLTLSTDNDFTAANLAGSHANIAQNLSFLMVGNDNGGTAVQFTELESPTYNGRIGREWKVQATNFSQNVGLQFAGWGSDAKRTVYLIKKNGSSDFSTGTTQVGQLDANGRISGVTLNNNDFFTLALVQKAPGGVLNGLSLWYRADAGTSTTTHGSTVSNWQNQLDGVNATATGTPVYQSTATTLANYNPTIFLDNSATAERFNIGGTPPNETNSSMFVVGRPGLISAAANGLRTVFRSNTNELDFQMHVNASSLITFHDRQPFDTQLTTTLSWAEGELALANGFIASGFTPIQFSKNGSALVSTATPTIDGSGKYDFMGGDLLTRPFGSLADAIVYATNSLSPTEIGRVNSYLALKYGISLKDGVGTSYMAGDGSTVFWDNVLNSGYNNDIFGIGRDDRSDLQQRQSISVNQTASDLRFTIYLGDFSSGSFPTGNTDNINSFTADNSFLMVGNDNASISAFAKSSETPGGIVYKLPREWKVQEKGTVGQVTIVVPVASMPTGGLPSTLRQNFSILVSDSSDFSNGSSLPMTKIGTDYVVVVDLNDGQFFSFGYGDYRPFMRHGKSVNQGEKNPMKF